MNKHTNNYQSASINYNTKNIKLARFDIFFFKDKQQVKCFYFFFDSF